MDISQVEELANNLLELGSCADCGCPVSTIVVARAHAAPNGFACDLYRMGATGNRLGTTSCTEFALCKGRRDAESNGITIECVDQGGEFELVVDDLACFFYVTHCPWCGRKL